MFFNYDGVRQSIRKSASLHCEDYSIPGGSLDDIEKSAEKKYDLDREDDTLTIYGDNVFAILEENPDRGIVQGSVRKSIGCILGDEPTYLDRTIMDISKRF